MTTRIRVMNDGPSDVEVQEVSTELMRRDGQLCVRATVVISQGQFKDFYVYDGQQLVIDEAKP